MGKLNLTHMDSTKKERGNINLGKEHYKTIKL